MNDSRKKRIIIVYIILCLCFIWGQSILPRAQSSGESSFLLDKLIHPFEEALFGQASSTEEQVRKAAHVFEYTCLGAGLAAYFGLCFGKENSDAGTDPGTVLFRSLSAGLFAALIDETIQIFSGRGPMIRDVWIDGIGVLQGALLGLLIIWLAGRKKQEEKQDV